MNPELRIFHDFEKLSRHAANLFIEQSNRAIIERDRFLVALNGGNTPRRLFQLLGTEYRDQIEWRKVHVFWGDERCVPPDNPGSNYGQARDVLLSRVPILDSNIHRVKTDPSTRSGRRLGPAEASRDYSLTLKGFVPKDDTSLPLDVPRFDLVYLGMGEDGHTASLFPGSPVHVTESVIPVTAQYQDRPADRVTMTQLVFNQARMIVFMVTGEKKAIALAEVLSDRYNPEKYPAQRIDPKDGELIWLVDDAAASKLPKKIKGLKICEG